MKVPSWLKRITPMEIAVGAIFVLYMVLPVSTPRALAPVIHSPLGFISIFLIIVSLFLFANPILAVLYLGVAYLLLLRSAPTATGSTNKPRFTRPLPIDSKEEESLEKPPPPPPASKARAPGTLEEEVISSMAPPPVGQPSLSLPGFQPVAANTNGAFLLI